jgi:hypothetical protein
MTKSGMAKDERDTPMRHVRHRDGKFLRGGIGLTTGYRLGWSDRCVGFFLNAFLRVFVLVGSFHWSWLLEVVRVFGSIVGIFSLGSFIYCLIVGVFCFRLVVLSRFPPSTSDVFVFFPLFFGATWLVRRWSSLVGVFRLYDINLIESNCYIN